jgi:predicted nucleic acid-binding protein
MTVAELHGWAEERRWGAQRKADLERFLSAYAIHLPDLDLCKLWATVTVSARRAGRPIAAADAWIAATALVYGVPLVTHDPRDFAGVAGLRVLTEASASA